MRWELIKEIDLCFILQSENVGYKTQTKKPKILNYFELKEKKKTLQKLQNIIGCLFFQAYLSSSVSICL